MSRVTSTNTDNMGGTTMADTITVPETTETDLQAAEPKRPFWQTEPCPAWCFDLVGHQDHEHPDDRIHMGSTWDITLTLKDPEVAVIKGELEVTIPRLDACLMQGWREHEPRIHLAVNDEEGFPLTLAEAAELAETLSALVTSARAAG